MIPDACDDLSYIVPSLKLRLRAVLPTAQLRRRMRAGGGAGHAPLIWFGHQGTYEDVGMLELLRISTRRSRVRLATGPLHQVPASTRQLVDSVARG